MRFSPVVEFVGPRICRRRPGELALPGVLFAVLLSLSCSEAQSLQEWTLELEEMRVLGDDDEASENAFFNPSDLGFDGSGRLYVLDSGNHRVQIYDAAGDFLGSRGSMGSGPGDLQRPEGMWIFPDGELVVADTGNRRLQRFGPAGHSVGIIPLDYVPLDVVGTPQHMFVLRLPPSTYVYGPDPTPLVQQLDREGRVVAVHVDPVDAPVGILYFLLNTFRIAATPNGGFALADTHVNSRIRVFSDRGEPLGEIPTLYKPAAIAPLGRLPKLLNPESLSRIARTAVDVAWDPQRDLYWVLSGYVDRTVEGDWVIAREIYRYTPDGEYRGSLMLPFRAIALAAAPDNTVWVLDVEGLAHRFRIRDPDVAGRG